MLGFLRKLFKDKERVIEKIKPEDLKDWFETKIKLLEEESQKKLSNLRYELLCNITLTEEALKLFENAQLRNTKIPVREFQFMEGNRRSYIQRTSFFLKQIREISNYEISFFLNHYHEYVTNFVKSTDRSYRILQEFFADEVGKVAQRVKEIDKTVENIRNDTQIHNCSRLEKIRKNMSSIENRIKKKDESAAEIEDTNAQLAILKQGLDSWIKKKEDILSKPDYKAYLETEDKKKQMELRMKSLKDALYSDFSLLNRPLRKYCKSASRFERLIEHYTLDAFNALLTDFNFNIIEILKEVQKSIAESKLTLKDKQTEKVRATIDRMNRSYFEGFMNNYNTLLKEKNAIEKSLSENIFKIELVKADMNTNEIKEKIKEFKSRLSLIQDELAAIDIVRLREKLKLEIEQMLNIKIVFV